MWRGRIVRGVVYCEVEDSEGSSLGTLGPYVFWRITLGQWGLMIWFWGFDLFRVNAKNKSGDRG